MIRTASDLWRASLLIAVTGMPLPAQRTREAGADARVSLVLRPFPGDMIRQRVEHDVDEQGTITMPGGDSTVRVSTRTMVVLRSKVDAVDSAGAIVTSQVESVTVRATDRKSTRLNSSHERLSRMPSSA